MVVYGVLVELVVVPGQQHHRHIQPSKLADGLKHHLVLHPGVIEEVPCQDDQVDLKLVGLVNHLAKGGARGDLVYVVVRGVKYSNFGIGATPVQLPYLRVENVRRTRLPTLGNDNTRRLLLQLLCACGDTEGRGGSRTAPTEAAAAQAYPATLTFKRAAPNPGPGSEPVEG